jgi:hypothetical protein
MIINQQDGSFLFLGLLCGSFFQNGFVSLVELETSPMSHTSKLF